MRTVCSLLLINQEWSKSALINFTSQHKDPRRIKALRGCTPTSNADDWTKSPQKPGKEDSRRTTSYSYDKDNNNEINAQHGCKCHTKYEDEMEISSAAERETVLGEFQREI